MPRDRESDPRLLCAGDFLCLYDDGGWEYVRRMNISGIVAIAPFTDDGRIVLIEQYRPPLRACVVEIPAGLVGDVPGSEDEAVLTAARRELTEETGYEADRFEELVADAAVSAGTTGETITLYRATGLRKVGPGGGDDSEEIAVHEVPVERVGAFLSARRADGVLVDVKVYAALHFAPRGA